LVDKKVTYIAIGVVVLAVAIAAVMFMMTGRDAPPSAVVDVETPPSAVVDVETPPSTVEEVMSPASIAASDHAVTGRGWVSIDSLFLDKPGYVVIHAVIDGAPGAVLGNSGLLEGSREDVVVQVSDYRGRGGLIAMLHYDDGDGEYLFPGPDAPTFLNDEIVMIWFKIS